MKRDMDLVRELLLKLELIEKSPSKIMSFEFHDPKISVPDYSVDQIEYHIRQMVASGFIDFGKTAFYSDVFLFRSLTPYGHDFLDSIRDPEVWAKTKKAANQAGGFTLEILRDLAKGLIKTQIKNFTGLEI